MKRIALLLLFAFAACDPVHADQVDALGGETAGVRKGPLHRPGQPCIVCHDGAIGDPSEFSVAGTVYVDQGHTTAANGATVTLTSSDGSQKQTTTNAAGNFYLSPNEYAPVYPVKVDVLYQGTSVKMTTRIGREGSCNFCHTPTPGPSSAGPIFIPAGGVTP